MNKFCFILSISLFLFTASVAQNSFPQWEIVFRNDAEGNVISGSKEKLVEAVRSGYPVRVGWGFKHPQRDEVSVEHVADAAFLTVMSDGRNVQAQINPIVGQKPDFKEQLISFREANSWVLIANTNGKSASITRAYVSGEVISQEMSKRGIVWYVQMPPSKSGDKAKPLY